MKLFTITETYEVELNRPWIRLIPEFEALIRRDKGSPGDYRGDKKLKARRELAFIYFDLDFSSPLREWEEVERRKEALVYVGLKEEDLDPEVMAAHSRYQELLYASSRSLKTLDALRKGLDMLDKYFKDIDFTKTDKQGKVMYTMDEFMNNVIKLPKLKAAIGVYEKAVEEELKADTGIRGKATRGGKEGKRRGERWEESGPPDDDKHSTPQETIEL